MLNTPLAQDIAIIAVLGIPSVIAIWFTVVTIVESRRAYHRSLKGQN